MAFIILVAMVISLYAQNNYRYITANLNLRMESSATSTIITTLPEGTVVQIDEDC